MVIVTCCFYNLVRVVLLNHFYFESYVSKVLILFQILVKRLNFFSVFWWSVSFIWMFISALGKTMSVPAAKIATFLDESFRTWMIFSAKSLWESWVLLRCDVSVRIFLTFCNFKYYVFSSFIVIYACSSLSTSSRKSMSGSRNDDRCDILNFFAIYLTCSVKVIVRFSVVFVIL